VGAVINSGAVRPGQGVAVVGLGGVGLSALLGAVAAGAHPIVAVDLSPEKLAFAKELGATHCFDARDEGLAAAVKQATDGGVHVAIELAGSVRALETAFAITRRGGLTVTAGLANPAHNFAFPPVRLVGEELTLRGSYVGSCVPVRDIPRFITLYKSGDLPVNKLLTSRSDLNGINAALDQLAQGKTVRHVITF
jgi:alcohol dehydrogenase